MYLTKQKIICKVLIYIYIHILLKKKYSNINYDKRLNKYSQQV